MTFTEAEKQLAPCSVCGSQLKILDVGNYWYRATCTNSECWYISRKHRTFDDLIKATMRAGKR